MVQAFKDRVDAGRVLARLLGRYHDNPGVVVLGLPRGGVPVAYEVARSLKTPLDVFVVRKLGVPGHEELAMGALASGGVRVLNCPVIEHLGITGAVIDAVTSAEARELQRREAEYRGAGRAPLDVGGRTVILVDDGLATGSTMRAAACALRQQRPLAVAVAVPVAAAETCEAFRGEVDDVICALTPADFRSVGMWYDDFSQTTDEEVRSLMDRAAMGLREPQEHLQVGRRP